MIFKRPSVCRRSRVKCLLIFSTFLLSLSFITTIFFPEPSIQKSYESMSILVERTQSRSEYFFLNREFLEFLSRTSIECHIQVEPGDKWNNQALVTTKLYDDDTSYNTQGEQEYNNNYINKNYWSTVNIDDVKWDKKPRKYILAYRHFEQLGKTVENFIQLAALAKRWDRLLVIPDIKNSRFSLEPSVNAYPMDAYFDVENFNRLLDENGYAKLVRLNSFLKDCSFTNTQVKTTLVHFLYNGYYKGNTKLWYHLSETDFKVIMNKSLATGWTVCNFIDKHLGLSKLFNGVSVGRQLCVNPEVITSETIFDNTILKGEQCVIFVEWRGFGTARTHFKLRYWPFLPPRRLKHSLSMSDLIEQEVIAFKKSKLPSDYISVHLRTEKVLNGRSFQKLQLCVDHVVHVVSILRDLRGVAFVFLATDVTRFGSDAFERLKYYKTNVTGRYRVQRGELARLHEDLARRLRAITYNPAREPFSVDKGIVSLVEMNILKGGQDLVSAGGGTFHAWIVSKFKEKQKQRSQRGRGYTITEICFDDNA